MKEKQIITARDPEVVSDVFVAGYVLIRKYVVDQALLCGGEPKRIASMRALAAKFGVASSSVQKALKDLIADGFLTVKPGIGMFTNPEYGWTDTRPEVVELLVADGRQIYYKNYLCSLTGEIARHITETGRLVHFTDLFHRNQSAIAEVNPDTRGMIWIAPDLASGGNAAEFIRKLNIPTVILAGVREGYSCVDCDYAEEGYRVGRELLKEGRKRVVLFPAQTVPSQRDGMVRAFREAGESLSGLTVFDRLDRVAEKFSALVKQTGIPEAICDFNGGLSRLQQVLFREKIDWENQCRIVVNSDRKPPVPHWKVVQEYGRLAATALELLDAQIADPRRNPEVRRFARKLERGSEIPGPLMNKQKTLNP